MDYSFHLFFWDTLKVMVMLLDVAGSAGPYP